MIGNRNFWKPKMIVPELSFSTGICTSQFSSWSQAGHKPWQDTRGFFAQTGIFRKLRLFWSQKAWPIDFFSPVLTVGVYFHLRVFWRWKFETRWCFLPGRAGIKTTRLLVTRNAQVKSEANKKGENSTVFTLKKSRFCLKNRGLSPFGRP